jgi:hypothetical protein
MRNNSRMPILEFLFSVALKGLIRGTRQEKDIKDTQIGKEKVRLCLFADGMTLTAENHSDSI